MKILCAFLSFVLAGNLYAADVVNITLGKETLTLEIARTQNQQSRGLMGRKALAPNHGMLFCLRQTGNIAMWMKNTLIDLDAAFVDKDGLIFHMTTMKANTETLHYAFGNAHYVIEMNARWFETHRIQLGTQLPELPQICKKPQ